MFIEMEQLICFINVFFFFINVFIFASDHSEQVPYRDAKVTVMRNIEHQPATTVGYGFPLWIELTLGHVLSLRDLKQ